MWASSSAKGRRDSMGSAAQLGQLTNRVSHSTPRLAERAPDYESGGQRFEILSGAPIRACETYIFHLRPRGSYQRLGAGEAPGKHADLTRRVVSRQWRQLFVQSPGRADGVCRPGPLVELPIIRCGRAECGVSDVWHAPRACRGHPHKRPRHARISPLVRHVVLGFGVDVLGRAGSCWRAGIVLMLAACVLKQ